jgi:aryl-alcohol dehydrogenase-like predicted oxidoreductase
MLPDSAGLPVVRLGGSDLLVSRMALGSWRTYERMSGDEGLAVMRAAQAAGVTFLDDARYNDETGGAPIPSGYSEVVFGELFRASGWRRDHVVVSNKLWWEFWPQQSAAEELDASLGRMGFDYIDVIYANAPPEGMSPADLVAEVGGLVSSGKARAWGLVNWPADQAGLAVQAAPALGVTPPCAIQLPYSLVRRSWLEDAAMTGVFEMSGAAGIASFSLAGGVLSGKYLSGPATGRATGTLEDARVAPAVAAARELAILAGRLDTTPAALALAFPLTNPIVSSVLFGATSAEQVRANCAAIGLLDRLGPDDLAELQRIGQPEAGA